MADAHQRLTNWKIHLSRTTTVPFHPRLVSSPASLGSQLPSAWWTPSWQPPWRPEAGASSWVPRPSCKAAASTCTAPLTMTPAQRAGSAGSSAPRRQGASEGSLLFPNPSSPFTKPRFPSQQGFSALAAQRNHRDGRGRGDGALETTEAGRALETTEASSHPLEILM